MEASYDTALAADPLVGGDVVLPSFAVPEEPTIPLLPTLPLLPVPVLPGSDSDRPWLDPEPA